MKKVAVGLACIAIFVLAGMANAETVNVKNQTKYNVIAIYNTQYIPDGKYHLHNQNSFDYRSKIPPVNQSSCIV